MQIYTDGAYAPSRNQGGWAYVIENGHFDYNGVFDTTSNRMEMTGVLEALKYINREYSDITVIIFTDSQYVWGTLTKGWKRNKNEDLWNQIDFCLNESRTRNITISFEWIRGHDGNEYNEKADKLAVRGSKLIL